MAFEAEMIAITQSKRFGIGEEDLSWLLQAGTLSCVAGKLLCGPLVSHLGVTRVGFASLILTGLPLLGVGLSSTRSSQQGAQGAPLIPIFLAWCLVRFFQTATWPATNQFLLRWFPKGEHGWAWGIMSTASRTGILSLTLCKSVLDSHVPSRGDPGDGVQATFLCVGSVTLIWAAVISHALHDGPPACACEPGVEEGKGEEPEPETTRADATLLRQLATTMAQPLFILGTVAQACATPLAEFQSQVPILTSRDPALAPRDISLALTLWHLGMLVSALAGGWLFDRSSILLRIPIIAGPALVNSLILACIGIGWLPSTIHGWGTLAVVCLLGATAGPANFLVASTLISTLAPPQCMASISCIMVPFV